MPQWPKPSPGSPLRIPASLQSRLIDLASQTPTSPGPAPTMPMPVSAPIHTTVLGYNPGAADIPAFGVARAIESGVDPEEQLGQFLRMPTLVLEADNPGDEHNQRSPLVIAANRIRAGGVGQVVVAGVVPVRVAMERANDAYAEPDPANDFGLRSSDEPGPLRMLTLDRGTGVRWGYAMLGGGGGGGVAPKTDAVRCIIMSSASVGTTGHAYEYKITRAIVGDPPEPPEWTPDSTDPADWLTAYNSVESVGYDTFTPLPIADGVGVIAYKFGEHWFFSVSSTEGSCDG